ncbi:MAG: type II toxin-antitoxin system VapC family toxin [Promethearchaeota archaeon]
MENMAICLDTDILIPFLREDASIRKTVEEIEMKTQVATTSINFFELYYGAYNSKKIKKNLSAVNKLSEQITIFDFDLDTSKLTGKILLDLEKAGEPIGFRDTMIGAVAILNKMPFFTRNQRHFKKLKRFGLELFIDF